MARQPRNTPQQDEVVGYINVMAVSRKTGAKKKIAWTQVHESDDIAAIAPQLAGTFTSTTGVIIEITFNHVDASAGFEL